jgi:hypothetical protein
VVTLLVEETNTFCHQYYIKEATNNLSPQGITGEELKAFSVLNLQMERDKEDISEELLVQQ